MAEGAHYVEMTLLKGEYGANWPKIGVVGQGFDAAGSAKAYESAEGWLLDTRLGAHRGRHSAAALRR